MDARASSISQSGYSPDAQDSLVEDIVGLEVDQVAAQANIKTIRVSDQLFQGLLTIGKK